MKKTNVLIILSFLTLNLKAQNIHVLNLIPENWNLNLSLFYITDVLDERSQKNNSGFILSDTKTIPVKFKTSIEGEFKNLIASSVKQDISKIPLILSIEQFYPKETGTTANHKVSLEFNFKFYRIINDKRYKLYETNGKPELVIKGKYLNAQEKIITETLKSVIKNFNEWIKQNPDQPPLADKVVIILVPPKKNRISNDTIFWNESYKLKWTDFKGKPGNSPFMAQSNCVFTYKAEPLVKNGIMELHVELNACFEKKSSWVKEGQQVETLLSHEQLHFDICELNIRNLKKRISNSSLNPMEFDAQINAMFNQVWDEYQIQQQLYDDETGHGIISEKQQSWQKEIKDKLDSTDN